MTRYEQLIAELERELTVLVRRDRAAVGRLSRDVHPALPPAGYGLLVRLGDHGPQRPTDLAEHVGVTGSTIVRQLQPLEAAGLIERCPVPNDHRAHLVTLTGEGRRRIAKAQADRGERLVGRLAEWAERDVRALVHLLAKFNRTAVE